MTTHDAFGFARFAVIVPSLSLCLLRHRHHHLLLLYLPSLFAFLGRPVDRSTAFSRGRACSLRYNNERTRNYLTKHEAQTNPLFVWFVCGPAGHSAALDREQSRHVNVESRRSCHRRGLLRTPPPQSAVRSAYLHSAIERSKVIQRDKGPPPSVCRRALVGLGTRVVPLCLSILKAGPGLSIISPLRGI